jgi:broad specificity phosphatase PhoE
VSLVRHGETAWTLSGQHTGTTDVPVTERGREQARRLGGTLTHETYALVLSSPLRRARETCELAGFGDRVVIDDDLREWDYGAYEGRTTADIRTERPGWSIWTDGAPGGETAAEVGARIDRVIARVHAADGDVLVFGHGHSMRVLAARWLGLAPENGRLFALSPGSRSQLGYERELAVIVTWNLH